MITPQELIEKAPLIKAGMEFQILNHAKTMPLTIKVTSVSTITKSSCWGDYQKTLVWFETRCQATKSTVVTVQNPDGTTSSQWVDVPKPGVFYTDISSLSLPSFIEYKFNKRLDVEA